MSNTLVVNLFGGPCIGKSTLATELYSELNKTEYSVELAHEFAKELCWDDSEELLKNQLYILGNQLHRIDRLDGKVDIVITDSPLLLSIVYNEWFNNLDAVNLEAHHRYNNFNVLLKRQNFSYDLKGRKHNLNEAVDIDWEIEKMLLDNRILHWIYIHNNTNFDILYSKILKEVKKIRK
ncbi:MAG: AAA family ATPase [Bacteroidales bacterium]